MSDISCPAPECYATLPQPPIPKFYCDSLICMRGRPTHLPGTTPATAPMATGVKAKKVKHPVISASGTSEEWTYFSQRWSEYKKYKQATRLTAHDIIFQLLECCDGGVENIQLM